MSYPDSTAETVQAPGESEVETPSDLPFDARSGMFQKLIFTGTWLARTGPDSLGMSELELSSVLAFPIPSRSFPLIVTPGFGVHYLEGPESRDLPPRVYDAYAQFRWMRRLSPSWGIDLAITPGVFSDFEQSSDEAFRITGHAATAWTASPTLDFVLGAAYIDRQTTKVLPIAGIVWKPNNDVKFDLVFPHPRIARRDLPRGCMHRRRAGLGLRVGRTGRRHLGRPAQRRRSDMVDYTDYRLILGAEHKALGRLDYLIEVGYVFGRKIRFASDTPRLDPNDTVMVRGGVTY